VPEPPDALEFLPAMRTPVGETPLHPPGFEGQAMASRLVGNPEIRASPAPFGTVRRDAPPTGPLVGDQMCQLVPQGPPHLLLPHPAQPGVQLDLAVGPSGTPGVGPHAGIPVHGNPPRQPLHPEPAQSRRAPPAQFRVHTRRQTPRIPASSSARRAFLLAPRPDRLGHRIPKKFKLSKHSRHRRTESASPPPIRQPFSEGRMGSGWGRMGPVPNLLQIHLPFSLLPVDSILHSPRDRGCSRPAEHVQLHRLDRLLLLPCGPGRGDPPQTKRSDLLDEARPAQYLGVAEQRRPAP